MIRIFGFVIITEREYDSMCEIIDRNAKGNWLIEQNEYLRRTITDLGQKLDYSIFKHPDLEKDFDNIDNSKKPMKVI